MLKTRLAALVFILSLPSLASAQETAKLTSRILGEERTIDVALPKGYAGSTERYPVIVVLDGEFEGEIATAITRFYAGSSILPKTIVVGVRNTNRNRDMTPTPIAGFNVPREAQGGGGADKFLGFIGDELLPYIDRTYRTAPMRVLVGHSLGGLLAFHALNTKPELFTGYVAMEPAVWWNNENEIKAAKTTLTQPAARRARLMLVNVQQLGVDTTHWGGDKPMVRQISITGETHESMAAAGMLNALKTIFADFRPTDWKPGTKPVAMLDRYDSLAARVGYPIPIPENAFERATRMTIHSRDFEQAERMIARMERAFPSSSQAASLRELLVEERSTPLSKDWIPLEIPATRPSPQAAAKYVGRWTKVGVGAAHEITVSASGDTIIVHDRIQFPDGSWDEGDHQVIQVTPTGSLEWGLPWFRGLAALLVLKSEILPDGTMRVTREPRGWVPRGPAPDMHGTSFFKRVP